MIDKLLSKFKVNEKESKQKQYNELKSILKRLKEDDDARRKSNIGGYGNIRLLSWAEKERMRSRLRVLNEQIKWAKSLLQT